MCMMMLYPDRRHALLLQLVRVFGREIFGMEVVSDDVRLYVEKPAEVLNAFPERA